MTKLRISDSLSLPLSFVTGTQGILATKGKGKTYLAQREGEELLELGQVIIAIDPTDAWWGLRSSADGKSDGYPVVVFGGDHGDVKLEESMATELADAIIAERFSAIVCTEGLSAAGEVRFVRTFLERLYRRNREPIHVFVDEADMFAPQKPMDPEESKSIRAMSNVVRRGRKKGIGCTMITQRPSVLNKDVLSQVDMLMVLGMSHPLDLEPVEKWVRSKKNPELVAEMMDSLPELQTGDAWAWSPTTQLHKRFRASEKKTFDSGATPKPGQKPREAKRLAPVDIARIGATLSAAAERQKADDPRELRAQVAKLQRELAAEQEANAKLRRAEPTTKEKRIEVAVLKEAEAKRLLATAERMDATAERLDGTLARLGTELTAIRGTAAQLRAAAKPGPVQTSAAPSSRSPVPPPAPAGKGIAGLELRAVSVRDRLIAQAEAKRQAAPAETDGELSRMERAMLNVLAQNQAGLTKRQIRVRTGYADSGPVSKSFARLLSSGWATQRGDVLQIAQHGLDTLGDFEPLPQGDELRESLLAETSKLSTMERKMLTVICEQYPQSVTKAEVRERTGYADSGPVSKAFAHLVALDYCTKQGGSALRASDDLYSKPWRI